MDAHRAPAQPPVQPPPQRAAPPPPPQAPYPVQERALPPLNLSPPPHRAAIVSPALQPPAPAQPAGLFEPSEPVLDLELPAPAQPLEKPREKTQEKSQEIPLERPQDQPQEPQKREKKRKAAKAKPGQAPKEAPAGFEKAAQSIPRKLRLAKGQIVEIELSKEEAAELFPAPAQRPQQGGEPVRAVSLRLSAPEGGFFIETMTPETQWLSNRSGTPGEEPFGVWSWAVVPNETGWRTLQVSVLVRTIDAKGDVVSSQVAVQAVEVRVRANFGRFLGGLIRTLFLLAAGAGLAAGAWYVLKSTGNLPF